ncbi:hypothetical protein [Sporosarcina beigongshangi]|uniref:hypothetical protein n=1 Tax=Sporosarcina beigongshangi TaxID=2782538 RepID=UPI00193ABFE3|nr:hypothetical protein [Sporosarcina beigongshangi]
MIPVEVENRIANYFFHVYLPEEAMRKVEARLLPPCLSIEDKAIDPDELVRWAIDIIDEQLENKRFR